MTPSTTPLSETVMALRKEFDSSFAQAPRSATAASQSLLAIRLAGVPYAIRVADISGLHADRLITPLPTPVPQLLGVVGLRGQMAPVFDLASLCGHARAARPRWLLLMPSREPVALAFETFERHFSVAPEHMVATQRGPATDTVGSHTPFVDAVRCDDAVRPIIPLLSLLQELHQRANSFIQKRRGQT